MRNKILNKIKNCNYNYSKNWFYHIIVPCVAIVVGLILFFTVGFNKGIDFAGGINASIVVEDLNKGDNYKLAKEQLDNVLEDFKISGEIYQTIETNYYGSAISVKFENTFSDKQLEILKTELKQALEASFYPDITNQDELNNLVKVNSFGPSVSSALVLSSILAVVVAIVGGFVYIASRFGLTAGISSMCVALLDVVATLGWVLITRINVESTLMISLAFVAVYSMLSSIIIFSRTKENLAKEKFAKSTNCEIANQSIKDTMLVLSVLSVLMLVVSLMLGVLPTYMIGRMSLPMLLGCLVVLFSSIFITPGLWSLTFIRKVRKQKQQKQEKEEVVIEEQPEETVDIEKAPEVIVETEAKEN